MNQSNSKFVVILITVSSEEEADKITSALIEKRLAACVNRVPITSTYRWQGSIHCDREWQLTIKTQREHFEQISNLIQSIHSYEVPEIIALPIMNGYAPYLDWIENQTTDTIES